MGKYLKSFKNIKKRSSKSKIKHFLYLRPIPIKGVIELSVNALISFL